MLWYEQSRQEKISPLSFFYEVDKSNKNISSKHKATLKIGSKIIHSYQGIKYEVEIVVQGYLYQNQLYKSLSGITKEITVRNWNGKVFLGVNK